MSHPNVARRPENSLVLLLMNVRSYQMSLKIFEIHYYPNCFINTQFPPASTSVNRNFEHNLLLLDFTVYWFSGEHLFHNSANDLQKYFDKNLKDKNQIENAYDTSLWNVSLKQRS